MKIFLPVLILALPAAVFSSAAAAQDRPLKGDDDGLKIIIVPKQNELPAPDPLEIPELDNEKAAPETDSETAEIEAIEGEEVIPEEVEPDYSKLSPAAEREARLNDLFEKLAEREEEQTANLVAEEIVAIWTDSGSASVNLMLRRGTDAAGKNNPKLARKMYNHAVDLSPGFAEAWARSARLALAQKEYNRALNESLTTLALEPRHFYTLWTLGNVLEALDRQGEALETYREANRLYPEFKEVKERLEQLETQINGTVL